MAADTIFFQGLDMALAESVRRPARRRGRLALLPMLSMLGVCGFGPAGPQPGDDDFRVAEADVRVLFLGNSLTYSNDLPAMVATIAEAAGHTFAYATLARPNFSLEDHWNADGRAAVRSAAADFVIMQQGPSSLPENQEYLRTWTERFAPLIREAGGEPALYMVWPDVSRRFAFGDVRDSYRNAASAVQGRFMPAGEAWRLLWEADADAPLYSGDGFHPSRLGSEVAALAIFRVLFEEPVTGLPARMVPTSPGLPVIDLGDRATAVFEAVELAVAGTSGSP